MSKAKRIDVSLLDDEFKLLLGASTKIFPVKYDVVESGINPNNFEYIVITDGEHINEIYRWNDGWFLIGADDRDVRWDDITNKPVSYNPIEHTHDFDSYTRSEIDTKLGDKSNTGHTHAYAPDVHNHDTIYSKIHNHPYASDVHNHDDLYSELNHTHDYSPSTHTHSEYQAKGDYANSTHHHDSVYSKIHDHPYSSSSHHHNTQYSDINHNHPIVESDVNVLKQKVSDIENGYTEGHTHSNLSVLVELSDSSGELNYKGKTISTDIDLSPYDNHLSDNDKHITIDERNKWNGKSDAHNHPYALDTHNHSGIYSEIHNHPYAPDTHNHNGVYSEVHNHPYSPDTHNHDTQYAPTHNHPYSLDTHNHDSVYVKPADLNNKVDITTFNGHTGNASVHVTQTDKNTWNSKSKITISSMKPNDSDVWFKI